MIEIEDGIFWDENLTRHEQSEEVLDLLSEYLKQPPIDVDYENCDSGNQRPLFRVYVFGNIYFKVQYIYLDNPYSSAWAGVKDKIYTVYGK